MASSLSLRLSGLVYLARQQNLLGRTILCRFNSGNKTPKKPPTSSVKPKAEKPLKPTAEKGTTTTVPPSAAIPQADISTYKAEEYYTFNEYSYYDLDTPVIKLRCPVPSKYA